MKTLPIGVDDFKEIIEKDHYYVDKTGLITALIDNGAKVSVFTRPRRFGKTLALSMLRYFFESERDCNGEVLDNSGLFEGLEILDCGEKYTKHMGEYPVVFMSLKSAKQASYELAYDCILNEIAKEFDRHRYVLSGPQLSGSQKEQFTRFSEKKASESECLTALEFLTRALQQYFGKKVIVLLDEYDVPLENAWFRGFYGQMVDFTAFYQALLNRDIRTIEREMSMNLMETISFYDYKEDYYHAYTAGLLKFMNGYRIKSNREGGLGRSDIMALSAPYDGIAIIIEIKVSDTFAGLDEAADKAQQQIEERQYDAELRMEGYHTFLKYGFAFYKKLCRVKV